MVRDRVQLIEKELSAQPFSLALCLVSLALVQNSSAGTPFKNSLYPQRAPS